MPSPDPSSISFSKASCKVFLKALDRLRGPYFTISADILSIPGAFGSIDISLFSFLG